MAKMGKSGAAGGMKHGASGPMGTGRKIGRAKNPTHSKAGSLVNTPTSVPMGKGGK